MLSSYLVQSVRPRSLCFFCCFRCLLETKRGEMMGQFSSAISGSWALGLIYIGQQRAMAIDAYHEALQRFPRCSAAVRPCWMGGNQVLINNYLLIDRVAKLQMLLRWWWWWWWWHCKIITWTQAMKLNKWIESLKWLLRPISKEQFRDILVGLLTLKYINL